MKVSIKSILLVLFAGGLLSVWILGGLFYYQASRPGGEDTRPVIVHIPPGATLKQISIDLKERRLIHSASAFRLLAHIRKKPTHIQVGEYELNPSMLPVEILNTITSGKTILHPVTIPEGYRITEIASLLADRGLVDKAVFIQTTHDPELLNSLNIPSDSVEGYLFPETYYFSKYTSERKIIQTLLDTFKQRVLTPELLKRLQAQEFSLHEIVTLASLIEKETGAGEERRQISAVFHNRLRKDMRLQTDPTVIYAIKNFDGNIRKKDLSIDSPYNTYKYKGLPPGPIASPGLQSIIAALSPVETKHLYFVSRKDGSHHFSSSLKEHNRAVRKYQLKRTRRR
ncbi:aminodeoxychorismate lyase [Candidatus Nitromaritima sp. SCGC AAA799-C22]|nr:aminodeoxychorismate lyase [Candidatus Nitromaritima sp. SCGC AAA799-C22]